MLKSLLPLLFLTLSFQACAQKENNLLTSDQLVELMNNEDVTLVDIRTPQEFMWGYIEGATNIDYYDFETFSEKFGQLDKSKPVVVYCAAGVRSHNSIKTIKSLGFTKIYDLKGGFNQWLKDGKDYVRKR